MDHEGTAQPMRFGRRRLLLLAGGAAATGLLATSVAAFASESTSDRKQRLDTAVAAVADTTAAPRKQPFEASRGIFEQASQTGFVPIASSLTFGPPNRPGVRLGRDSVGHRRQRSSARV